MPTILEAGNVIAPMEGRPSKGRTRFGNHWTSERSLEGFRDLVLRMGGDVEATVLFGQALGI